MASNSLFPTAILLALCALPPLAGATGIDLPFPAVTFRDFNLTPPAPGPRITAALSPTSSDNSTALNAALTKASGGGMVVIPAGTYNLLKPIQVKSLTDITIEGNGARFVLTKDASLNLEGSTRLVWKDLVFDWDWQRYKMAYFAKVVSNDGRNLELDFPLDATVPTDIDLHNVEMIDDVTYIPTQGGREWWEPKLRSVSRGKTEHSLVLIDVADDFAKPLKVGTTLRIRQWKNQSSNVWNISDSSQLLFRNIAIQSGGNFGWVIANNSHHILLNGCRIAPNPNAPGSQRVLACFADGLHVSQFTGYLGVTNCVFAQQGDDALNIKENVASQVERRDDTHLYVVTPRWRTPFDAGDLVDLRDKDYRPLGQNRDLPVVSAVWDSRGVLLTLGSPLPPFSDGPESVMLINQRYSVGHYYIRNNYFCGNRARGILPKLSDGVIEGNLFEANSMAAILFDFGFWNRWNHGDGAEGGPIERVEVRHNVFRNTNAWHLYAGPIDFYLHGFPVKPTDLPDLFQPGARGVEIFDNQG